MADNDESKNMMERFYGTYRGFSPTDESAICMGELEVKIDKDFVKLRMATGLKIHEEKLPTSKLEYITKEAMGKSLINPDSEEAKQAAEIITAFSCGNIKYIFQPALKCGEYGLVVTGSLGDFLGPTVLVGGPKGVQEEAYQEIIQELLSVTGGEKEDFPTLSNGGRALKE